MTREELQKRFPNCTEQFLRLNASDAVRTVGVPVPAGHPRQTAKLERGAGHGALAAGQVQKADAAKFFVRVTSYRRRLLDEDNICEKFAVDCCRYAGVLPGDNPAQARIITTQEKAGSQEEERTEIIIERIAP